jgi:hypothetical protein
MENQNIEVILKAIIQNSFKPEFIENTQPKELRKRAIGILLSELAEYEVDTILEIAAVACDESNWSELGRSLRIQARNIDH